MNSVYVAGPLDRPWRKLPIWVEQCYRTIDNVARIAGWLAAIPFVDRELDYLKPPQFMDSIEIRIKEADKVVAVLLPDDPSVPVECAMAAAFGKPILLIHESLRVPRVLVGLRGLEIATWGAATDSQILNFLTRF